MAETSAGDSPPAADEAPAGSGGGGLPSLSFATLGKSVLRGDIALALGVVGILVVLILPMPKWLLDISLALLDHPVGAGA